MNKRKDLANYLRQSQTAAEPSWEESPRSRAGTVTVGGFLLPPFIHTILPSRLPEVEVEKGVLLFAGDLLHWEGCRVGRIAVARFLLEADAF